MEPPTPPPSVPPGWHDDPNDPTSLRYWDGNQWTDNRAPKQAAAPTAKKPSNDWTPDRIGAALGAVAIIIGSFSPWVTASAGFVSVTKNGTEGDGQISLIAGGLILVFVAVRQYVAALIASALAGALLLYELIDVQASIDELNDDGIGTAAIGWGLWLAAVGAAVAFATSINLWKRAKASKTTDTPDTPDPAMGGTPNV